MDISKLILQIQYVLAPAIMVSSAALLLLGIQNKFSNLASRFRSLNSEKRALNLITERSPLEEQRLKNLQEQIHRLMKRAGAVKNAILCLYFSIVVFMGTSILIFLNVYANFQLYHLIVAVFVAGLLAVMAGCLFIVFETILFYTVIRLEQTS